MEGEEPGDSARVKAGHSRWEAESRGGRPRAAGVGAQLRGAGGTELSRGSREGLGWWNGRQGLNPQHKTPKRAGGEGRPWGSGAVPRDGRLRSGAGSVGRRGRSGVPRRVGDTSCTRHAVSAGQESTGLCRLHRLELDKAPAAPSPSSQGTRRGRGRRARERRVRSSRWRSTGRSTGCSRGGTKAAGAGRRARPHRPRGRPQQVAPRGRAPGPACGRSPRLSPPLPRPRFPPRAPPGCAGPRSAPAVAPGSERPRPRAPSFSLARPPRRRRQPRLPGAEDAVALLARPAR